MVMITNDTCPKCGGTMAEERDDDALRVFCVNCGEDRWLKLPCVYMARFPSSAARFCVDCNASIEDRHPHAIRCASCAVVQRRRLSREQRLRKQEVAA